MDKKRVSVFVAGQRFTILTDEDEKYVIDIAAKIDARITSLTISQNITRERAAVLTALDYADDNEQDKRAITEIKEQIKDYITQVSALSDENTALNAENNQLKRELAALKAADTKEADTQEKDALKAELRDLKAQLEALQNAQEQAPAVEEQPAEEEITSADDLFFGEQEEPAVKPAKDKKNRHEHSHVNPYQQKYAQKKDGQKGYTQQRQYSFFDIDE